MTEEIKKPIANVTVNYKDKTQDKMEYYAMVGWSNGAWYSVMFAPPETNGQIKMRNKMIELSAELRKSIDQQQA